MKHRNVFKASFILVLIVVMLLSSTQFAFADTTSDTWVTKASMSTPRSDFRTVVVDGKIYAIGGRSTAGASSSVEVYDPVTNTWATKASMSIPRFGFEAQIVDGKIYIMGGNSSSGGSAPDSSYLSSVEVYDIATDKWTTKKSMSTPRHFLQSEVINDKIYVMGGFTNSSCFSSVEVYDPVKNTWTTMPSMSTPRYCFQTELVNGKIYAIGGSSGVGSDASKVLSSIEVYDPVKNTWTTKASMSTPRRDLQTEVVNGKIYAIGGLASKFLSSIEEYNPTSNTWTAKKPMSNARWLHQTEVIGGKIYAIGGANIGQSVEAYDPVTDTWITKASMSASRTQFQTEVIGGKIYAIGGRDNNGALNSMEEYTVAQSDPTLTITASSNKVKVGQQFTTAVAIHKGTNICAEDIKITYDTNLFTYAGAEAQTGLKIYKEDTSTPGTIRFISACQGKSNAATGDKGLITLKFTAKKAGTGKVDIIKGRIADNATLEMDVADANCGEDTITVEGFVDVNRTGDFTLLDLGIDGWYNGMNAADADTAKFDADVVADGKIDDNDLAEITKGILSNSSYQPNT